MLSSRDLMNNMLRGRPCDRIGYFDHGPWFDTLRRWVGEGYPTRKNEQGEDVPDDYQEHFGYDMRGAGGWFDGMPIRDGWKVLEETDDWVITQNGAGTIVKNFKNQTSSPEYLDFTMTSREVWERDYRPHLLPADRARLDVEDTRANLQRLRAQGQWVFYGNQFIWENMRGSMGNVVMLESLLLDPAWIHDFCRVYTDLYKALFRILIEEAGVPDGIWIYEDLGYRNGLVCSPKTLETLIFPYYAELNDFFHTYDLPVILHTDGRIDEAIPLIIDAGFAAINPMEVKAGCDLFAYAEQYGDRLAFVGGLDGRVLETNDRDIIRAEVTRLIDGLKARGARFTLGVDHSISAAVSYDAFRYMIEVYRERMWY